MTEPVLLGLRGVAEALVMSAAERPRSGAAVTRRCVDVAELLAAAAAGLGRVAICARDLPGLGPEEVAALHDADVVVLVVDDERRASCLGADLVVGTPTGAAEAEALLAQGLSLLATSRADVAPIPATTAPPASGHLVAVWGPTGAPGRSTVAINLAAELASRHGATLLVDADTYGGAVAQLVGVLDEAPGLAAATRAAAQGRLDAAELAGVAPLLGRDLRVLTGISRADRWPELGAASLSAVWPVARSLARWVVVDTGFCLESDEALTYDTRAPRRNAATLSALEAADLVVAVGSGDPVGLARLVHGLGELTDAGLGTSRLVVVNRVRASVAGRQPARAVRQALERHAGVGDVVVVPDDRDAADRAVRDGRTLAEVAPTSAAREALTALAARVAASLAVRV
ncbi:MAG: hypothetical protein FWD18_08580 [Micrococcales bacterium]|nr:hypothetical protein [Micrococcales bacterium]